MPFAASFGGTYIMPTAFRRRHPIKLKICPRDAPVPALNIPFDGMASRRQVASVLVGGHAPEVHLDRVFLELVEAAQRTRPPGFLYAGTARETPQVPGCKRTLRMVCELSPQQLIAVDVTVQARQNGLHVQSHLLVRPTLARFRVALFLIFWPLVSLVFFLATDIRFELGQAFAQKYFTKPDAGIAVLVQGWDVDATPGATSPYRRVTPWRVIDYFCVDPICFLQHTALVPLILAGAAAGMTLLIPRAAYRYPCRWLGWPTPDEIDAAVQASKGWVEHLIQKGPRFHHKVATTALEGPSP